MVEGTVSEAERGNSYSHRRGLGSPSLAPKDESRFDDNVRFVVEHELHLLILSEYLGMRKEVHPTLPFYSRRLGPMGDNFRKLMVGSGLVDTWGNIRLKSKVRNKRRGCILRFPLSTLCVPEFQA